jgi:hypothetical protein
VKRKVFLTETSAPEHNGIVLSAHKCMKMAENEMRKLDFTISIYNRSGLQTGSDTMFENTGIPTEDEHLQ